MAFVGVFFITATGKVIEKEKQQFILTRHFYFMFLLYDDDDDAQRPEHNTMELALFFHFYVGSRCLTQVVKFVQQKAHMQAPLLCFF